MEAPDAGGVGQIAFLSVEQLNRSHLRYLIIRICIHLLAEDMLCITVSPQRCQSSTVEGLFITLIEHLSLQHIH